MDNNAIAKRMAAFGQKEAALMRQLAKVQADRCAFLTGCIPNARLDADVVALASEPKDGGGK